MNIFDDIQKKMFGAAPKKLENISDQSNDEIQLVGFIKQKVEEAKSGGARIAREGSIMTNIAYLLGFDSVYYDTNTRQFRSTGNQNRYLKRNRVHVNKVLPTIQNRLARLCKNPPKYDVRPESDSTDDKDAARLGLEVINDIWDKQQINAKRLQLMMWVQQAGYAFAKVCWDDQIGKFIGQDENGDLVYEGDIRFDVVSPLEIYQDPLAKTMEDCQWVVQAKIRKLDYFNAHYPEKGHLVKEEGAWLLSAQYEMRINSLSPNGPTQGTAEGQMRNSAIELAYYEKRSKKHPNGRMIICANGVLLEDKELPCGEIPFVKFDDVVVGGSFYSESIITHLRPIQDQFNRLITKRAEWTNKLLGGKYIAPKGHGMHSEMLNDQSGEVVEFNPVPGAPAPQAMNIPNIPQYAYAEEDKLNNMINDISGIGEISRGGMPSAGIPAIGMQFLQEQDETRIGIVTEQNEQSWAKVGRLILKYASKYYKTPRVLKIAGEGLGYAVKNFMGADIKDNCDAIVIRGSTLPNSKVLKRQEIINAYSQGLLGDPADPKLRQKVLSMLEYGDVAEAWRDMSIDMAQIKKTIEEIKREEIPEVSELDNHELHIQEKNRYRKSEQFGVLSETSKTILLADIEAHTQALMHLMNPGLKHEQEMADEMASASQNITPGTEIPASTMNESELVDPMQAGAITQ